MTAENPKPEESKQNQTQPTPQPSGEKIQPIQPAATEANQQEQVIDYKYLFENAVNGMLIISKDFILSKMNKTLANWTGINPEEVCGKKCYDVMQTPICRTPDCPMERLFKGEENFTFDLPLKTSDGKTKSTIISCIPKKNEKGEILGVLEDFKDVTDVK